MTTRPSRTAGRPCNSGHAPAEPNLHKLYQTAARPEGKARTISSPLITACAHTRLSIAGITRGLPGNVKWVYSPTRDLQPVPGHPTGDIVLHSYRISWLVGLPKTENQPARSNRRVQIFMETLGDRDTRRNKSFNIQVAPAKQIACHPGSPGDRAGPLVPRWQKSPCSECHMNKHYVCAPLVCTTSPKKLFLSWIVTVVQACVKNILGLI